MLLTFEPTTAASYEPAEHSVSFIGLELSLLNWWLSVGRVSIRRIYEHTTDDDC